MLNLVIATTNVGKIRELNKLMKDLPLNLQNLKEFENIPDPLEDGKTFADNAELKAKYYALKTNAWALADDSGLEVEALDNAPGVFSARFAGKNATDEENISKLLKNLKHIKNKILKARFVCEMAISDESGKLKFMARGICNGKISRKPFGNKGFGYDPIFIPDGYSETFGELSSEIKQQISHRAVATEIIIQKLTKFLSS